LPAHSHSAIQMVHDNNVDGVDSSTVRSGDHHNQSRQTGVSGGGRPHNNMQPYIALTYCKKI
jgi:microcystin-dependent protein